MSSHADLAMEYAYVLFDEADRLRARAARIEASANTVHALASAAMVRHYVARGEASLAWSYATRVLAYRDLARAERRRARGPT